MAVITVTTTVNQDDPAASVRLNGEAVNINGGTYTVNSDSRWGRNTAVHGNIVLSTSLVGEFLVDGTTLWELPFNASTGVVPALGNIGSNGATSPSASGEVLRVWNSVSKTPLTAGVAMPTSGWIKLRSKTGEFEPGQTVALHNGATITITSAGKCSWLHFVSGMSNTITTTGMGSVKTRGDWHELGMTSGVANQQIQYPVEDICPAVQIEISAGSGVYEWWLNAGSRWGTTTKYVPQDARGKFFGCTAAGVITFALTGANACGLIPTAGCKIRIPNVLISYSSATNWAINLNNTALTSRFGITVSNYGAIDFQFLCGPIRISLTNTNECYIKNCALFDQVLFNNPYSVELDNTAIGLSGALSQSPISLSNAFSPSILNNITAVIYASNVATTGAIVLNDCNNVTLSDSTLYAFGGTTAVTRGSTSANTLFCSRLLDSTISNVRLVGARLGLIDCDRLNITDVKYSDSLFGSAPQTNPQSAVSISQCDSIVVDGYSPAFSDILDQHPFVAFIEVMNSTNVNIHNFGTVLEPLNSGSVSQTGVICSLNLVRNINVIRAYATNTRTAAISATGIIDNVKLINVKGDYADTGALLGRDITSRGCAKTMYIVGQNGTHGKLWDEGFNSATTGFIGLCGNRPTATNINEFEYELVSGNPVFSSAGAIYPSTVGDQVIWKMKYFALGHLSITGVTPSVINPSFLSIEFQYDIGAGMNGVWTLLNTANLLAIGSIDPTIGIKFWIRMTAINSSPNTRMTYIVINTESDAASQLIEYPLAAVNSTIRTLTLTGIKPDSEVRLYDAASNELSGIESVAGTFEYAYQYNPATVITVVVFNVNYKALRFEYTLANTNSELPIQQSRDMVNNE